MGDRSASVWNPGFTVREGFEASGFVAGSWTCDGGSPGVIDVVANHHEMWLQRTGSRSLEIDGRRIIADSLTAVFHNAGEEFRSRSAPGLPQRSTVVLLDDDLVAGLLEATGAASGSGGFATAAVPLAADAALAHFRLRRTLRHRAVSALEVEERVFDLLMHLLRGDGRGLAAAGAQPRSRARRELVESVRHLCALRYAEKLLLADIGRSVGASPFHLSRIFARDTGMPIHRYLVRLRLRAALERMADGEANLSRVALDVGFSSHSHFTTAFRREYGRPPAHVLRSPARTC